MYVFVLSECIAHIRITTYRCHNTQFNLRIIWHLAEYDLYLLE